MPRSICSLILVWLTLIGVMPGSAVARAAPALVDANHADAVRLMTVPGIGPGMAARLVIVRQHGPFRDWADLVQRVAGLGAARAQALSAAGLTVNGLPWQGLPRAAARTGARQKAQSPPREAGPRAPRAGKRNGPPRARRDAAPSAPPIRF
jgi:competence protein ComEA